MVQTQTVQNGAQHHQINTSKKRGVGDKKARVQNVSKRLPKTGQKGIYEKKSGASLRGRT